MKKLDILLTPSEVLAERIVGILSKKKLITDQDANKLSGPLSQGKIKAEDWRVLVEKAMAKEIVGEKRST